ncbi:MAG: GNAT family N-acetyltransferase [Alphaproteobacteria bacterium]|nr:GNAT family N-acetyltransferase [Alphaproteobacteria bacterium]
MRVRAAVGSDVPALMALGRVMHNESRYSDLPFEALRVGFSLHRWIIMDDNRVAVAEAQGRMVGAMVSAIGTWYFHGGKQASDLALFVLPEHRGSRAALLLVRDFLDWAAASGCIEATIATSTGINPETAGRFLERTGFEACGGVFKQRLRAAPGALQ